MGKMTLLKELTTDSPFQRTAYDSRENKPVNPIIE